MLVTFSTTSTTSCLIKSQDKRQYQVGQMICLLISISTVFPKNNSSKVTANGISIPCPFRSCRWPNPPPPPNWEKISKGLWNLWWFPFNPSSPYYNSLLLFIIAVKPDHIFYVFHHLIGLHKQQPIRQTFLLPLYLQGFYLDGICLKSFSQRSIPVVISWFKRDTCDTLTIYWGFYKPFLYLSFKKVSNHSLVGQV